MGDNGAHQFTLNYELIVMELAPILTPSMNGLNHLRKQCINTLIDKILDKLYASFIVQVQPKLLLKLQRNRTL